MATVVKTLYDDLQIIHYTLNSHIIRATYQEIESPAMRCLRAAREYIEDCIGHINSNNTLKNNKQ